MGQGLPQNGERNRWDGSDGQAGESEKERIPKGRNDPHHHAADAGARQMIPGDAELSPNDSRI